jgi:hypothetical protein
MGFGVTETEYIIGRVSGKFVPPLFMPSIGKRPIFGPATKEAERKEEKSGERKEIKTIHERATDEFYIEFCRESARIWARNQFNPVQRFISATDYYYQQPAPDPFNLGGGLFGIQAYVCKKCYAIKPRMLYFVLGEKGGSIETPIFCNKDGTHLLMEAKMTGEQYINYLSKHFPRYLKECIDNWTHNKTGLIAAEVSDATLDNDMISFVLSGATGEKKSITLQYSEENCIDLNPKDTGSWVLRAIKEKRTSINEEELEAFLDKTGASTFGFFKITGRRKIAGSLYLIAVVKDEGPGSENNITSVTTNNAQDKDKSVVFLMDKQQAPTSAPPSEQQLVSEPVLTNNSISAQS